MGIGFGEGLVLLLIAALFLRGEEFSTVARKLGQWMGQAQRMSRSFMDELQREADRSGLDDSTREIRKAIHSAKSAKPGKLLESWIDAEARSPNRGDAPGPPVEAAGAGQGDSESPPASEGDKS